MLSGGVQQVRVVLRAVALLRLAEGVSAPRIAGMVPLTAQAIRKIGHRYREGGLERALCEKERPGAAAVLENSQKQRIIAFLAPFMPMGGPLSRQGNSGSNPKVLLPGSQSADILAALHLRSGGREESLPAQRSGNSIRAL